MSFLDTATTGPIIDVTPEPADVGEATHRLTPTAPRRLDTTFRRRPGVDPTVSPRDRFHTIGIVDGPPPAPDPVRMPRHFSGFDAPAPTSELPVYVQAQVRRQPTLWERLRHQPRHRSRARRGWMGGDR